MSEKSEFSYVALLRDEFLNRNDKNPRYSLRAFAGLLNLSPAYISLVFSGQRHLSSTMASKISKKLNWSLDQQKYFLNLIEFENPKTEDSKEIASRNLKNIEVSKLNFNSITLDTFSAISMWQHSAILAFLTIVKNKATISQIAKKFNLDLFETESALRRLQRLGLVKPKSKFWQGIYDYLKVASVPSEAIRAYHKQHLTLAAKAIDDQDFDERDFSNMTLTVDRAQLQTAKKRIFEFHSEMANLLEGKNPTEVYQLSVQLFRLSQPSEKSK